MNLKVDYICRDCILLFSNVYSIWLDLNKLFMKMKFYEIKTNIYHTISIESKMEIEMDFENELVSLKYLQLIIL